MIPPVASLEAPLQGDLHLKGYHQEGQTAANYEIQASHMISPVECRENILDDLGSRNSIAGRGAFKLQKFVSKSLPGQDLAKNSRFPMISKEKFNCRLRDR